MFESTNGTAIIAELNRVVAVWMFLRFDDHIYQRFFFLTAINNHSSFKKPMTRMLAVALCAVKQFNARRVTFEDVCEEIRVVIQVPVVESEPKFWIYFLKRFFAFCKYWNEVPGVGMFWKSLVKRFARNVVISVTALGHFVTEVIEEDCLKVIK